MNYLLDTNVVSEIRRSRPSPVVVHWLQSVAPDATRMSVLTVGELRAGAERLRIVDARQAERLDLWLQSVDTEFRDRVIPVTREVAERWGRLKASLAAGPIASIDLLVAATALVHGWTVVTRNVRHFEPTGVTLLNPFDDR